MSVAKYNGTAPTGGDSLTEDRMSSNARLPSPLSPLHLHSSHPRNVITNQLLTKNAVNIYYASGDIAWVITATALVLLMIPGVG